MPRNSSGTYSLPAGNPVSPNTLIESGWANPTMSDLGSAITDSLDRYGRGTMLAALKITDGLVSAPGLSFGSEASTGLYRSGAGTLNLAVLGVLAATFASAGITFAKAATFSQPVTLSAGLTMGGQFLAIAGTVGAPGQAFVGDTDNGWWAPAADTQAWSTAGAERMRINASGNVGIGVAPSVKLHAKSASEMFRLETTTARGGGNGYISFYDPTGRKSYVGYGAADDVFYINNEMSAAMVFATSGTERMRFDASGNIGIGTAAPDNFANRSTLSINGTTGGIVTWQVGGVQKLRAFTQAAGSYLQTLTGPLDLSTGDASVLTFTTNGAERVRFDANGNVGIGVAPGAKLHVQASAPAASPAWNAVDSIVSSQTQNNVMQLHAGATGGVLGYAFAVAGTRSVGSLAYDTTNNFLAFNINSAERMRIDASGNVGIASAPVSGIVLTIGAPGVMSMRNATNTAGLDFGMLNGSGSAIGYIFNRANAELIFGTNNAERMRIDASGNIGIGISTPFSTAANRVSVSINAATDGLFAIGVAGARRGYMYANGSMTSFASDGYTIFETNGSERVRIDGSGRVTKPFQVRANAQRITSTQSLPAAAHTTIIFNSALSNVGAAFDAATGIFTAPVAGFYYFAAGLQLQNNSASGIPLNGVYFSVNDATAAGASRFEMMSGMGVGVSINPASNAFWVNGAAGLQLNAGDTVRVKVHNGAASVALTLNTTSFFAAYHLA